MSIILGTIIGLGIFLFGMQQLEQGLQSLGSSRIKKVLSRSTEKPLLSVASGVGITAIVQSSSMVSLMVLAFASAGMIPLFNAVGVILGANLGTTFTGWIVTTVGFKMDLEAIALPLFGFAAMVYVFADQRPQWRSGAQAVIGLSLLIFGLAEMKDAVETLPELFDLSSINDMPAVVYLLVGIVMTAMIQSSSAMTLITLTALHSGIVDLSGAAALIIGADIGTTSTTILGSLRGSRIMKQLALSHVVYNLVIDIFAFLVLLPVLPEFLAFVGVTDPLYGVVLFQSGFNVIGLSIFVPFLKHYANWLGNRFSKGEEEFISLYLHNTPAKVTEASLTALEKEVRHLLEMSMSLGCQIFHFTLAKMTTPEHHQALQTDLRNYRDFKEGYIRLKQLETVIRRYSLHLESASLDDLQIERVTTLLDCARNAVFSVKSLKDIQPDLYLFQQDDSESSVRFNQEISSTQEDIFRAQLALMVNEIAEDQDPHPIETINTMIELQHSSLHEYICEDLKALQVDEEQAQDVSISQITTMFNTNRGVWQANQGLLHALMLFLKYRSDIKPTE